jgi:hypothetical protein
MECISRSLNNLDAPWKKRLAVVGTIFAAVVTGGLALIPIGIGAWVHGARLPKEGKKTQRVAQRILSPYSVGKPGIPTPSVQGPKIAKERERAAPAIVPEAQRKERLQERARELFEKGNGLRTETHGTMYLLYMVSKPTRDSANVVNNLLPALEEYGKSGNLHANIKITASRAQFSSNLKGTVIDAFSSATDDSKSSVVYLIAAIEEGRYTISPDVLAFLKEAVDFVKTIPEVVEYASRRLPK